MRYKIFLTTAGFVALLLPGFAQAALYYEYAPDPWNSERFVHGSANQVEQVFQPRDAITLTGFDFWLDNTGSAGDITFILYNEVNNILSSKSLSLGSIGPLPGGQKFHVALDQNIELSSFSTYWIRISSALPGLGLYQSSANTFLTHNEEVISPYTQGRARLDGIDQEFTFKYALHHKSASGQNQEEEIVAQEEVSEESTNTETVISNARVVSVTASTVTLAWSSNVAADSSATIRTQLNPLYIIASAYDPTLELEHTLTVGGLSPNIRYFADVFSSQLDEGEDLLTTYTISFQTATGSVDDPGSEEEESFNETSQGEEPAGGEEAATQEESPQETEESTKTNTTTPLLPPQIDGGGGSGGDVTISWSAPEDGEPSDGYRIDIFDSQRRLLRQIQVPAGTHGKIVPKLSPGTHHVIVYANEGQVFKKIAAPLEFLVYKGINPGVWVGLGVLLIIALSILFAFLRYRKEHAANTLQTSSA